MPISAPASRESSRRSQCTCEPRPGGSPCTTTSTTPPRVSPSSCAWSIRSTICLLVSGSRQRTGSSSSRATSSGSGHSPSGARTPPSSMTWETIRAPTACSRKLDATRPSATRAAVSRAEARSRTGRASSKAYFCMPARSAWPGRGRVSGALRAEPSSIDRVDRVGRHHRLPLGPLGVADLDRDRSALGLAVPDAADQGDLVLLELHPGAAAVAEPAPGQRVADVVGGHPDVGGQPLEDRHQGRAVGLTRGQPAQSHGDSLSRRGRT